MLKEEIKEIIYEIRGKKVVLVSDLAKLCAYKNGTKTINLTIKRNINMFSNEDYFQLTKEENYALRFLSETAKGDFSKVRILPFVLTLNGIKILSTILKSKKSNLIISEIIEYMTSKNSYELINANNEFFPRNQGKIENLIYEINGTQVMLDSDLALLFKCKNRTKEINQAVKNNPEKFPNRYSWILNDEENRVFLVKNFDQKNLEMRGGKYKNPRVFTEQGVAMLATILKSEVAALVSVEIIDAFVNMRHFINDNKVLLESNIYIRNELDNQKEKLLDHDKKFDILFSKFESKEQKELLFFDGQLYDAYSKLVDILELAKNELIIIDTYADKLVLDMISNLNIKVTLITKENQNLKKLDILKYNEEYNNLKIIYDNTFHDRYIIIDKTIIYHCGSSLNHAGKKTFSINKLEDIDIVSLILNKISKL